jgi:hypothetical protein
VPEILRRVADAAAQASDDQWFQTKVLKHAMSELCSLDFDYTVAELTFEVMASAKKLLGKSDPYDAAKKSANQMMLSLLPQLREMAQADADPLQGAIRLAGAASAVPFPYGGEAPALRRDLEHRLQQSGSIEDSADLAEALKGANSVLYILDRAGEIVADRVLIEMLTGRETTCVVRREPILACATVADAMSVGLDALAQVIDPGAEMLGIVRNLASDRFAKAMKEADVVIAKGSDAFETLAGAGREVFFILQPYPWDADYLRVRPDRWVVLHHEPTVVSAPKESNER